MGPDPNKWHLAKTLIARSKMKPEDKESFNGLESIFSGISADRNIVAHCMFVANSEREVVTFLRVASKGSIKTPPVVEWSEVDFVDRLHTMSEFEKKLEITLQNLRNSKLVTRSLLG